MYNLYDFCDDDPRIWDYDITSCFDDSEQFRVLNLHFPGVYMCVLVCVCERVCM